jgi:endonuclease YncB( thermonuclease family)
VQHKVRLAGIDAPESGQAFGNKSKQSLSDCAFAKQIELQGEKVDRYQRRVAKVVVNGVDCNLRQIELGMAWHYKKYAHEQSKKDQAMYAASESKARGSKLGLWSDKSPVAPWDWRNGSGDGTQRGDAALRESAGQCDCAAQLTCTGKRGGQYCLTTTGAKRYVQL